MDRFLQLSSRPSRGSSNQSESSGERSVHRVEENRRQARLALEGLSIPSSSTNPPTSRTNPPAKKKGLWGSLTSKVKGMHGKTNLTESRPKISRPQQDNSHQVNLPGQHLISVSEAMTIRERDANVRINDAAGLKRTNADGRPNPGTGWVPEPGHVTTQNITRKPVPQRKMVGHKDRQTTLSLFINASPDHSQTDLDNARPEHAPPTVGTSADAGIAVPENPAAKASGAAINVSPSPVPKRLNLIRRKPVPAMAAIGDQLAMSSSEDSYSGSASSHNSWATTEDDGTDKRK